jgi:DNA-binding phage protein
MTDKSPAAFGAAQYLRSESSREAHLARATETGDRAKIDAARADVEASRSNPPRWWRKPGEPAIPKLGRG